MSKSKSKPGIGLSKNNKNNIQLSNKIKPSDDNFKILLNMIMGVQLAIQSTGTFNVKHTDDLDNYLKDYKYSLPNPTSNQERFSIVDFAGALFNNIRNHFGITKSIFVQSISPQDFVTELMICAPTIIEELFSTGQSGSLFYFTRNGRFIVKTLPEKEFNFLRKIFPDYYAYMMNPVNINTMLPKFLGCYRLVRKQRDQKHNYYFIIMENIFMTQREIFRRYDLKGSKIGREVWSTLKDLPKENEKLSLALKDLDWERDGRKLHVSEKKRIDITLQLKEDTNFLKNHEIIDYSFLVGIHNVEPGALSTTENNTKRATPVHKYKKGHFTQPKVNNHFNLYDADETGEHNHQPQVYIELKTYHFNLEELQVKHTFEEEKIDKRSLTDFNKPKSNENISSPKRIKSLGDDDRKVYMTFTDLEDGGVISKNKEEIYYFGIIDILTEYNIKKKFEYFGKMCYYRSFEMSCIPPDPYRERFIKYMESIIESNINPTSNLEVRHVGI